MAFDFQLADSSQIPAIIQLMKTAKAGMANPEWFVDDEEDFLHFILDGHGFILIAVPKDAAQSEQRKELAAFFIIKFPGLAEDNLGYQLGFSENNLLRCAHMDSCVVGELFRGQHLQSRMAKLAEEILLNMEYQYLLATVHPENCYSMNSMLRCGYQIAKTTYLYGGLPRNILIKEI